MFLPFQDDNPVQRTPAALYGIIAINVAAFLWYWLLPNVQQQVVAYTWGFVPARVEQLRDPRHGEIQVPLRREAPPRAFVWQPPPQQVLRLPPDRPQILLTLLTCMFLHGGWLHLIFNMWFLWIFGDNIEDRLGSALFLVLYLLGGLLASAAHWAIAPASEVPVVGASGAVAAVLGAYAITWPWARVHTFVFLFIIITVIDLPAMVFLGVWFFYQLVSGYLELGREAGGGVAFWAHVGGFVAGAVLMPLFSALVGAGRSSGTEDSEPRGNEDGFGW